MAGVLGRTDRGWATTAKAGVGVLVAVAALFKAWSEFSKTIERKKRNAAKRTILGVREVSKPENEHSEAVSEDSSKTEKK